MFRQFLCQNFCLRKKYSPAPPAALATNPPFFPFSARALRPRMRVAKSTIVLNYHENRHHHQTRYARSTRCRATRLSEPSRSWPRPRSRTARFRNGFAFALATQSATTPREGTGERLALESKRRQTITWHSRPTCTDGTDIRLLWHFSMK